MSAISKSLGRTVKTNIVLYSTDNMGRDHYITYNNGGFWKDNIRQIKLKPDFPRHMYSNFHSLIHQAAPFNYFSDGTRRDTYVIKNNAGLVKEFNPLANRQILSKYLREHVPITFKKNSKFQKVFLTPSDKQNFLKIHNIQNKVVNRLYNQSLEKFKEKMRSDSPMNKNSFKSLNGRNNYPYIKSESSLMDLPHNKNRTIANRMNGKILRHKMNKTYNYFCLSKKEIKNNIIEDSKNCNTITENNVNNKKYDTIYNTFRNDNKSNSISREGWNPILTQNNTINNYTPLNDLKISKIYGKKTKIIKNKKNLSEIENYNSTESKASKQRPKSCRKLFRKSQIFNAYKPFLVDDFNQYSDNEN